MSQFVKDIIKDLKANPLTWNEYKGFGCKKGNTVLYGYGNTRVLSIVSVKIGADDMPLSYTDRWKLETAIGRWYKSVPLNHIQKTNQ